MPYTLISATVLTAMFSKVATEQNLLDGKIISWNKYIHLNPVEAKMVDSPEEYRWSSYTAYISNDDNHHVTTEKILAYFSDPVKENYRNFVESEEFKLVKYTRK